MGKIKKKDIDKIREYLMDIGAFHEYEPSEEVIKLIVKSLYRLIGISNDKD